MKSITLIALCVVAFMALSAEVNKNHFRVNSGEAKLVFFQAEDKSVYKGYLLPLKARSPRECYYEMRGRKLRPTYGVQWRTNDALMKVMLPQGMIGKTLFDFFLENWSVERPEGLRGPPARTQEVFCSGNADGEFE